MSNPEFVIWSYPYDEETGGIIALHALCYHLNRLGIAAALWPFYKPLFPPSGFRDIRLSGSYIIKRRFSNFPRGPFSNPISTQKQLAKAICLYPEIVAGNPLRAKKVVRWLLHRPGFHTGQIRFGEQDVIVPFNPAFIGAAAERTLLDPLRVTFIHSAYCRVNDQDRVETCYMVRKGRNRALDKHPPDAILADGLSHEELAKLFNRCRFFYCYDPYTFYSVYAAICGCTPIIIPEEGIAEEEWEPIRERRLGLAYGQERVDWAEATRDELLASLARSRAEEDAMILKFVASCRTWFDVTT